MSGNLFQNIHKEYQKAYKIITEAETRQQSRIEERYRNIRGQPQYYVGDEVLVYWSPFEIYNIQLRKHRFRYEGPFTL